MEFGLVNTEPVIRTNSGKWVDVFMPTMDMIDIDDIAHGLSLLCRWGGQCPRFYSVAEHSLACMQKTNGGLKNKLASLMHDASEAYLVDLPRPIKRNISEYKGLEDNLLKVIFDKYEIPFPLSEEVKKIDDEMLEYEWRNFMIRDTKEIMGYPPIQIKQHFLEAFKLLT